MAERSGVRCGKHGRVVPCTDCADRLDDLEREALRLAGKPGIRKAEPSERRRFEVMARARLEQLVAASGRSRSDFASELLDVDESAVRRAIQGGVGLPLPWWLEAIIERDPELAAEYLAGALNDVRRQIAARKSGTHG